MRKRTYKNGGFTLVELIIVIAILAALTAIAVPVMSGMTVQAAAKAAYVKGYNGGERVLLF